MANSTVTPDGVRINKYIGICGYCSRRKADVLVETGHVTIDGKIAEIGSRVLDGQVVCVDGTALFPENEKIYILFHKPLYVTCTADEKDPENVIRFLNFPKRVYPVGRLDRMSKGLLLLTNDGDVSYKLLRTAEGHEKEYIVNVSKPITNDFIERMRNGVPILDTTTLPCKIEKQSDRCFSIVLTQGLNRQIRRMCEACGFAVKKLTRVRIMHLHLDNLPEGKWRHLQAEEVQRLYKDLGIAMTSAHHTAQE